MWRASTVSWAADLSAAWTWAARTRDIAAMSVHLMGSASGPGVGDRRNRSPSTEPRLFLRRIVANGDVGHPDRRQRLEEDMLDRVVHRAVALVDHPAHALAGGGAAAQVLFQRVQ